MKHEEFDFTKQVLKMAKLFGWRTAHFRPGMMANGRWITAFSGDGKGFPDLVLVRGSRLVFVALKNHDGELSEEQLNWLHALNIAGAEVAMWCPKKLTEIQMELERE